ncbi:CAP domain-containing protein [Cytobacillus purgationiresistens]|uniref:YkwD family protein n=1 Tax=Cytobacillus purgationiresistens TaxID=863449 RepID=A0ABU0AUM8_9BACI|nr:CAP domain-containing protein [Cytobacillus purgationiresistens]MDQ0273710.1 putative YkwD family protein [Cytobacillus purgationiresistens]
MSKKVIFSVAAAAALLISIPGMNKAEAASPVQPKFDSKAFVYHSSNMNQENINTIMQDCMTKYNVNWDHAKVEEILKSAQAAAKEAYAQKQSNKEQANAEQPAQPVEEAPAKEPEKNVEQPAPVPEQPVQKPVEKEEPKQEAPKQEAPKQEAPVQQPEQEVKEEGQKPAEEASSSEVSAFEQEVLKLTNQERAKNGVPALKLDVELSKVAREKSRDMQAKGYFDHNSPTYGSPFDMMKQFGISYSSAGENIAMGQRSPQEVVTGWMNSQGHRENILNAKYTHLGVGHVESGNYWTQMFIGK